mgnify:CR=1 FL=1
MERNGSGKSEEYESGGRKQGKRSEVGKIDWSADIKEEKEAALNECADNF